MNTQDIINEFLGLQNSSEATHLMRFFKTGKGQYGEGDKFLGIRVPKTRELVKKYYGKVELPQIPDFLHNEYHEIRLFGLLMLAKVFEKQHDFRKDAFEIYLANVDYINNWDLVDLTCPRIVGRYCFETGNSKPIKKLANSKHLWAERISVVSQLYAIKQGEFDLSLELCEKFLLHKHDLMHKACGWMLREVGKKDENVLLSFLDKNTKVMPRTMLRYSLEKLSPELKKYYMSL